MRKHMLGASTPSRDWSPRFARKSPAALLVEKEDKPRTSTIMSRFPSKKGPGKKGADRSVPLRRFSHIPMAELLEADPHIDFWYSNLPSDSGATELVEDADFVAHFGDDRIIYRVKRAPSPELSDAKSAFMDMASYSRIVLSANDLLADPRLPVARDILRVRSMPVAEDLAEASVGLASDPDGPKTLGALQEALGASDVSLDLIKAFIGLGYIKVRLADSLDATTPITGVRLKGWRL